MSILKIHLHYDHHILPIHSDSSLGHSTRSATFHYSSLHVDWALLHTQAIHACSHPCSSAILSTFLAWAMWEQEKLFCCFMPSLSPMNIWSIDLLYGSPSCVILVAYLHTFTPIQFKHGFTLSQQCSGTPLKCSHTQATIASLHGLQLCEPLISAHLSFSTSNDNTLGSDTIC